MRLGLFILHVWDRSFLCLFASKNGLPDHESIPAALPRRNLPSALRNRTRNSEQRAPPPRNLQFKLARRNRTKNNKTPSAARNRTAIAIFPARQNQSPALVLPMPPEIAAIKRPHSCRPPPALTARHTLNRPKKNKRKKEHRATA